MTTDGSTIQMIWLQLFAVGAIAFSISLCVLAAAIGMHSNPRPGWRFLMGAGLAALCSGVILSMAVSVLHLSGRYELYIL